MPEHASEPGGRKRGSRRRLFIVALIVLAIIGFIVWRIHENNLAAQQQAAKQAAAANRPTPVQTAPVQQKTVPVFLTALGTVTAYNTVTLQARVSGQLLEVNFREGQTVKKGQLLLQIDPRPYQAALDQAIGTLAKDEANLKDMQAEAERYTALYEAGVVSKEQQQLEINNAGQAEGSIKADQAAVEAARVNLGYTKIYSPIDGVVGLRQVDPGNIVSSTATTGLVVITQVHPIAVIFTLAEDQIPQVRAAMKGGKALVVEAYDRTDAHKIASGTLLTIDNQIDTTTGTAKLKAVFDNSDGSLFPNQFVNVRLILSERQNALVVPTAAIESGNQGDYVFAVNPGPTPADKIKNLPGETPANTTTGSSSNSTTPSAANTQKIDEEEEGTSKNGKPRQLYHADVVPVHVDFTIGTSSVLSNGTNIKPGQPIVVDGQEKLVDGSPVSPTQARTIPASNTGSTAGSANPNAYTPPPAAGSGGLSNSSPVPPDQTSNPSNAGQNQGQSAPSTGGTH
ncbi:MAG TPA: efflux RND transporter periplasmic adaptor subunit [Acidobacteriaceae bacterium]|nr:efflux RND transporter periplasmic adaptor subunit [Acidobacteriaceae bacterium]